MENLEYQEEYGALQEEAHGVGCSEWIFDVDCYEREYDVDCYEWGYGVDYSEMYDVDYYERGHGADRYKWVFDVDCYEQEYDVDYCERGHGVDYYEWMFSIEGGLDYGIGGEQTIYETDVGDQDDKCEWENVNVQDDCLFCYEKNWDEGQHSGFQQLKPQ